MSKLNSSFLVHKNEISNTKVEEIPTMELQDGEVLLEIDQYAFTTNNITYAVVGHKIGYWQFFPAEEPFGIVPVWGFANVLLSKNEQVKTGERFYGYFPMSTFLKVVPAKCSSFGFVDSAAHRQGLAPIYNYYTNTKADPGYNVAKENYQPIIRPLFTTSFLNYHFLKDEKFFAAEQVILTSASSKTAMGLAYLLKKNQEVDGKKIVGLTSARNVEFVKTTGYYDQVIAYDDLRNELDNNASTIVDLAGNSELLMQCAEFLKENLKYISLIGLTDWQSGKEFKEIPNSKFFFAPAHAKTRFEEWGVERATGMIAVALSQFIDDASKWMDLIFIENQEALSDLYHQMLKGKVDPKIGYVVKLK